MKTVGFIGIGVMGTSMVRNLIKAGFELSIYTRTKSKAESLISEGANWCDSVDECVKGKDAVITIVGYPKDVEQVYFGDANSNGILKSAKKNAYIIDMTTTEPQQAVKIYNSAKALGLHALDAPVSGGDNGAKLATLSIMVGGDKEDFEVCKPLFSAMGKSIAYLGKAGSGQHTKAANQIAIAGAIAGVCEALSYSKSVGLNPNETLGIIENGAAGSWQLSNNGKKILANDMDPGFYIKHYVKDLKIATKESENTDINLPILSIVEKMFSDLENEGQADLGTQALIHKYKF